LACNQKHPACNQKRNMQVLVALFNPETSILIQKCHPYTGNIDSKTPGNSENALHCEDVLVSSEWRVLADRHQEGPLQIMPDDACIIDHHLNAQAIQSIISLCLVLCFGYRAACCALTSISAWCL